MAVYQAGKAFAFMTKDSLEVLQPVAFGSRHCHGNKKSLLSHIGEGFASY
jgi:hypothetical protein